MTKFSIICLILAMALCLIQGTNAARIPRDAEEPATTPTIDAKKIEKVFSESIDKLQDLFKSSFTSEQFEEIGNNLKKFGMEISNKGKEIMEHVDAGLKAKKEE